MRLGSKSDTLGGASLSRSVRRDQLLMEILIPDKLGDKASRFRECAYGVTRATLVLSDGRQVREVLLAWGREIIQIGSRKIAGPQALDFHPDDIVEGISEVKP